MHPNRPILGHCLLWTKKFVCDIPVSRNNRRLPGTPDPPGMLLFPVCRLDRRAERRCLSGVQGGPSAAIQGALRWLCAAGQGLPRSTTTSGIRRLHVLPSLPAVEVA